LEPIHFPMRAPRRPPPAARWGLALLAAIAIGGAVHSILLDPYRWPASFALGLLTLLVAAWTGRARTPPAILVHTDAIELPKSPAGGPRMRVPFGEIRALDRWRREGRSTLLLCTARRLFVVPGPAFEDEDTLEALASLVLSRIAASEGGAEQLRDIERRHLVGRRAMSQRPFATYLLLGLVVLGFALQYAAGALDESPLAASAAMIRLGANAKLLVAEGEWFRLFTANFLHGGAVHIAMNGFALLSLGLIVERLVGSVRFLGIYLISAATGSIASALWSPALFSVGASTALFGLLGAFGYLSLRFGADLPAGFRQTARWWLFIIAVNGALPFLVPIIDLWAHVGGAAGGLVAAFVAYPTGPRLDPRRPEGFGAKAIAAVGIAAHLIAGWQASEWGDQDQAERAFARVLEGTADPLTLNNLAWFVAIDPSAARGELELAAQIAERAVRLAPERPEVLDTFATALARLGELERAVELEQRAIALSPRDPIYWGQLARFLGKRSPPGGTWRVEGDTLHLEGEGLFVVLLSREGRPTWVLVAEAGAVSLDGLSPRLLFHGPSFAGAAPGRFAWDPSLDSLP